MLENINDVDDMIRMENRRLNETVNHMAVELQIYRDAADRLESQRVELKKSLEFWEDQAMSYQAQLDDVGYEGEVIVGGKLNRNHPAMRRFVGSVIECFDADYSDTIEFLFSGVYGDVLITVKKIARQRYDEKTKQWEARPWEQK